MSTAFYSDDDLAKWYGDMVNSPPPSDRAIGGGEKRRPSTPFHFADGEHCAESSPSCRRSISALEGTASAGAATPGKGMGISRTKVDTARDPSPLHSQSAAPASDNKGKRRPSTPYHTPHTKGFDFETFAESSTPCSRSAKALGATAKVLAKVASIIRDPSLLNSLKSLSATVSSDDNFNRFSSSVQRTLTCTNVNVDGLSCVSSHDRYDFDEKDLMDRVASWGTQETTIVGSSSKESHQVKFHYPPVTSVRLRPRTDSEDIDRLFFAPEELDEIEDDRYDTRCIDDIETLAVGETCSSSTASADSSTIDCDDQDSATAFMTAGSGNYNQVLASPKQFRSSSRSLSPKSRGKLVVESQKQVGSPRQTYGDASSARGKGEEQKPGGKRLIRGVQILLREKSTKCKYSKSR